MSSLRSAKARRISDVAFSVTLCAWDYRNRLTEVSSFNTYDGPTDPSDQTVSYVYDSQNRLVARTLDTDGGSGTAEVARSVYTFDGVQVAAQFDHSGAGDLSAVDLSHRYLWNPQSVDHLLADEQVHFDAQQEKFLTDELLWALTDHQHSVRDLATYDPPTDLTTVANHRIFVSVRHHHP